MKVGAFAVGAMATLMAFIPFAYQTADQKPVP